MTCPKCGSTNVTSQAVTEPQQRAKQKALAGLSLVLDSFFLTFPGYCVGCVAWEKGKQKLLPIQR